MQNTLQIPFYVRYDEGISTHSLSGIGESIIGLEELLPKLLEISGIQSEEIRVSIKEVKGGCIIFGLDIDILVAIEIFRNTKDLYDIINFVDLAEVYKIGNEWSKENPFGVELTLAGIGGIIHYKEEIKDILSKFLVEIIKILPSQKNTPITKVNGKDIPTKIAQKAHRLVERSYFKKTLQPVFHGKVYNITYSSAENFTDSAYIDIQNSGTFVSDNQKILPDWGLSGHKIVMGKFVGWQRKKGNSVTFRVLGLPRKYQDLVCYPDPSMQITDFTEYLSAENLELHVEISRVTLFEKPKLIVHSITNLIQHTPF